MREVLLLKGKYEIIILPEFSQKAKRLYSFIKDFFEEKSFDVKTIETEPDYSLSEKISKNTIYLVGHSKGANKILKEFDSKKFQNIKGIILFDPTKKYKDEWNRLSCPKLLFVSEWGIDYLGFKNKIHIKDNHYFNESFEKIKDVLSKFWNQQVVSKN